VDDVTFCVQEGKIFGILSPNGAGKTTTVECIESPFSVSVNLAMVLSMAAVVVTVTGLEYQVPLPRQFGGFILTLLLATLALMGIGLCIANVAKTIRVAQVIGALCAYPVTFFSGQGPAALPGVASAFEYPLEPGEVSSHGIRVALEVLVTHTRESAECEHHLTAASVSNYPQGVIDDLARGQRDVVIEDTVCIPRDEGEAHPSHRSVHEPSAIDLFNRTPEPRSPLGQVGRV
jgi:hypothetical protein